MKEIKTKMTQKLRARKQKGITLIALVITIIVLLILAGVSIAMLTGQNRHSYTSTKSRRTDRYRTRKRSNCFSI